MSIQEALDLEKVSHLSRLFSPEILGRLPSEGHNRIRRTTLCLIGEIVLFLKTFFTQFYLILRCLLILVRHTTDPASNISRTKSVVDCPQLCCCCSHGCIIIPSSCDCFAELMWCESESVGSAHRCLWTAAWWLRTDNGMLSASP